MKVLFVLLVSSMITIIFAQEALPNVNCDEMVAQTGKRYHEVYVPHESNCNSFYQCTDHGLVELRCNRGLVFFPYINGCVERTNHNCITWNQWRSIKQ
ncbi:unnamed protein product [Chironomus riparius]|uniref:Chitin-binding type-2 domain-containing protein n=1 Tax=Chironomus riparius TaxID=315576 RepID=A0A9N9RKE3_9DIPT|nr:unnamed protein product [Chironomus riparius]